MRTHHPATVCLAAAVLVAPGDATALGDFLICTECGTEHRVTGLAPVVVAASDDGDDVAPIDKPKKTGSRKR